MYFRSERRHYNLFHPLRDLQMSWTDLFTFGNFWNHLQYEMTSHLEFMKLNNFTIISIFYLPILTFNSTMDSTLVCVWKCILEYCISLVISHYLLSLKYVDSISVSSLKSISHNQTFAWEKWHLGKLMEKCSVLINNFKSGYSFRPVYSDKQPSSISKISLL